MSVPYFDAHCDTITRGKPFRRCGDLQLDLERLRSWAPSAQVTAIFAPPGKDTPADFERLLSNAQKEYADNADIAVLCRSADEIKAAAEAGKIALILSVEGAALLGCTVEGLEKGYERGVRIVTLIWNKDNILCGSAQDSKSGLTAAGLEFCRLCWELGVAVDLSHASDATFYDVVEAAEKPVMCSHSDARALCDHPRNVTDDMLKALVRNKGYIGLNFWQDLLGMGRDIDAVVAHADHILSLGGAHIPGLGSDFDGIPAPPVGMAGAQDMDKLYEAMLKKGWSEDLVRDIFYNNMFDFMARAMSGAK